ncbi:hypothetical protein FRC09_004821 [Ceratobasidium sp. 395]|nr:hypothetical protein FRC09_004821 [Ceratobasidium sp. 395]
MARFRLYAPHIRCFYFDRGGIEVRNWDSLVSFSAKAELLPNLVGFYSSSLNLEMISAFLPQSTQHIVIEGAHRLMSFARALEMAAQTCTGTCSLEFFPQSRNQVDPDMAQPSPLYNFNFMSMFQNLHALTSTPMMLESPVLQLVAQLPSLSKLVIQDYEDGTHWRLSSHMQLPKDSFPALAILCIQFSNTRDAKKFWELMPPIGLKILSLAVRSVDDDDGGLQFIPALCRASPELGCLRLALPGMDDTDEEEEIYMVGKETFEKLAGLDLGIDFSLIHAMLNFDAAWANIASAWNGLVRINCLHQPTSIKDLMLLSSSLPRIESLRCDFDLEGEAYSAESGWMPVGTPKFFPNLKELTIKQFKLDRVALSPQYRLSDLAR